MIILVILVLLLILVTILIVPESPRARHSFQRRPLKVPGFDLVPYEI